MILQLVGLDALGIMAPVFGWPFLSRLVSGMFSGTVPGGMLLIAPVPLPLPLLPGPMCFLLALAIVRSCCRLLGRLAAFS